MHHMCYVNISNIELDVEPGLTPREIRLAELLAEVDTASHAKIDEICQLLYINYLLPRGRRPKLAERRARLRNIIQARLRNNRRAVIDQAKLNAFIGPLTPAQKNGHPF